MFANGIAMASPVPIFSPRVPPCLERSPTPSSLFLSATVPLLIWIFSRFPWPRFLASRTSASSSYTLLLVFFSLTDDPYFPSDHANSFRLNEFIALSFSKYRPNPFTRLLFPPLPLQSPHTSLPLSESQKQFYWGHANFRYARDVSTELTNGWETNIYMYIYIYIYVCTDLSPCFMVENEISSLS